MRKRSPNSSPGTPSVAWVSYASLEQSPYYELARKYLPKGAGAVFTFGVKGGYEAGVRLVESVRLFSHLANIGDTRSLILHPASTTHRQLTDAQRAAAGAGDDVIRAVDRVGDGRRFDPRPRSGARGVIFASLRKAAGEPKSGPGGRASSSRNHSALLGLNCSGTLLLPRRFDSLVGKYWRAGFDQQSSRPIESRQFGRQAECAKCVLPSTGAEPSSAQ